MNNTNEKISFLKLSSVLVWIAIIYGEMQEYETEITYYQQILHLKFDKNNINHLIKLALIY